MLQQIIHLAGENTLKQFELLDKVSQNIANMNTVGYKGQRFEQYLRGDDVLTGVKRTDFAQGPLMVTQRELDIAIKGPGFIPVTQADGSIAYTRDGSFAKNQEGFLVTNRGDLVGNGIQLPERYERIRIQPDGAVQIFQSGEATPKTVGNIKLVQFANPEGLESVGYNKLLPTQASGFPIELQNHQSIQQGSLEQANISVMDEISQVLRLNASVISNLRIVKLTDDLMRQSVNLRQ